MKVFFLMFCIVSGGECPMQEGFFLTQEKCQTVRDDINADVVADNGVMVIYRNCEAGKAPEPV